MAATPFRTDQQPLQGDVIYRYSFPRAMVNGFIKQVQSRSAQAADDVRTLREALI